ncbi:MAG: sensor histidine kinase [Chloroflexota bacterium]
MPSPLPFNPRSLTFKLVFAFWLVSLIGITVGILFAGQASFREIGNLADSQRLQVQIARLESYYQANGSWNGVDLYGLLRDSSEPAPDGPAPAWKIILVDPQGNVIATTDKHFQGTVLHAEEIERGHEIDIDGEVVGILIFGPWMPEMRQPPITAILERVTHSLLVGALAASAVSLLLGWLLARSFLKPIHALNAATQLVAQGDFENPVPANAKDEIGALARSFNEMIRRLKRARDQRRQMTADIAHELRTPLSLILGHTEAMSDGVLPPTPETLSIVYDEAQRLTRLVEDLRTLSLSETGELSLDRQPVLPAQAFGAIAEIYRSRAEQHEIELDLDIPADLPGILADADRIGQVLRNLLENALRFTPAGGRVSLSVRKVGNGLQLRLQDSGPGIAADDLPHVFERFYRADKARNRQDGGSGLGLAIARSLVELHGGKIWAESRPGQGAAFTIWLPAVSE